MWTNVILFNVALLGAAVIACRWGGKPEKLVAITLLAAAIATLAAYSPYPRTFVSVEYGVVLVDLLLLVALGAIALNANRYWPLCITSLHLASTIVHVGKMVDITMNGWAYALLLKFWAYPMVVTLVVATIRHRKRLDLYGIDRPWSTFNV